jgi:putative membrane protein (TIGR04086 family)
MSQIEFNDNEIECAQCGEFFYIELTKCPNCGVSVYFPEFQERISQKSGEEDSIEIISKIFNSIIVVAGGLFITSVITFFIFFSLKKTIASQLEGLGMQTLIFALTMIGAFVGGFVAARYAKYRPSLHGLIVGLLSVGLSILLIAYEEDLTSTFPPILIPIVGWGLITLSGLFGAETAENLARGATLDRLFSPEKSENELYQDLLAKVRFDKDIANRLIEYERQYAVNATTAYLIQSAIRRWERDNQ